MSNDTTPEPNPRPTASYWSTLKLEGKLALALLAPLVVGGLVASLLPWPEWQLSAFAGGALLGAVVAWVWLRMGLVRRLRALAGAMVSGRAGELPDPAVAGRKRWGEIAGLTDAAATLLKRQRALERDAEDLLELRAVIARLSSAAAVWAETERTPDWRASAAEPLPETASPLVDGLELASGRLEERAHEARVVAGLVKDTLAEAGGRAGAVASATERQFVEATSLLTVLRELKRWGGELGTGLDAAAQAQSAGKTGTQPEQALAEAHAALEQSATEANNQVQVATRASERLRAVALALGGVHESVQVAALESAIVALSDAEGNPAPESVRLTDALFQLISRTRDAEARARELSEQTA